MLINRKPALGFIFVTLLLDVIGFGIIIPVLPKFISELSGSNLSNASLISGWLMFSFSIMQFFFSPILGSLSDKFGRRPILLISLFGFCLNYILIAVAPSIAWLFVGRILAGIMGASFTTASAYIADISEPEKRAQNFGIVGAAFGLGFIIGPVLGGTLGHFGPRVPFIAAAGLTFLNWLYGYFVLPESLPKHNRRAFEIKRANPVGSLMLLKRYPLISGLVASLICVYIAGFATQSTWTFFTMEVFHWNEAMVGLSLGAVGLMVAIVQGGLIRIVNPKLGSIKSIYVGLVLYIIGFVLIAFATKGWMLFAFLVPYCLGGIAGPAVQGIMSNQVPANEQGELQGALTSLMSITAIIGPVLMTGLFSYFTGKHAFVYLPGAPFLMGALLTIASILLAQKTLKLLSHHHPLIPKTKEENTVGISEVEEANVLS
jgi:DHA1 family tetracycline resistance protein-like MFS transporter